MPGKNGTVVKNRWMRRDAARDVIVTMVQPDTPFSVYSLQQRESPVETSACYRRFSAGLAFSPGIQVTHLSTSAYTFLGGYDASPSTGESLGLIQA